MPSIPEAREEKPLKVILRRYRMVKSDKPQPEESWKGLGKTCPEREWAGYLKNAQKENASDLFASPFERQQQQQQHLLPTQGQAVVSIELHFHKVLTHHKSTCHSIRSRISSNTPTQCRINLCLSTSNSASPSGLPIHCRHRDLYIFKGNSLRLLTSSPPTTSTFLTPRP